MNASQCADEIRAEMKKYLGEIHFRVGVVCLKTFLTNQELIQSFIRLSDYGLSDALKLNLEDANPCAAARYRAIGRLDRIMHRLDEDHRPAFYARMREILDPEATATEDMIEQARAYLQTFVLIRFSWTNEVEKERERRKQAAGVGVEQGTLRKGTTDDGWLLYKLADVSVGKLRYLLPTNKYKCTSVRLERRTKQQRPDYLRRDLGRFLAEADLPRAIRTKLEQALNDQDDTRFIAKYYAVLNGQGVDADLEQELQAMLEHASHILWLYYGEEATQVKFEEQEVWKLVRKTIYPDNGGFESGQIYINPPHPAVGKPLAVMTINLNNRLGQGVPVMAELTACDYQVVAIKPGTDEAIAPNPVPAYWDTVKEVLAGYEAELAEQLAAEEASAQAPTEPAPTNAE